MKVSVVIPNYNGESLIKKHFDAVFQALIDAEKEAKATIDLVIVDDASTDSSLQLLEEKIHDYKGKLSVTLLINDKNLGFSPTVNRGVKATKGEIVFLHNSDIVPEKGFLSHILPHFTVENVFAVACLDKSREEGKEVLRGRGVGSWKRGFMQHGKGEINKINTLWASGGSSAFRKSIWNTLQGFNEVYAPYYWEDIDLSYRALKSSFVIHFEPKSTVVHAHEEGAILKTQKPFHVRVIAYRNQILFVWLNITDAQFLLSHILWLPYYIVKTLMKGDRSFVFGLLRAFVQLPKIIQLRNTYKKTFRRTDRDILREFVS